MEIIWSLELFSLILEELGEGKKLCHFWLIFYYALFLLYEEGLICSTNQLKSLSNDNLYEEWLCYFDKDVNLYLSQSCMYAHNAPLENMNVEDQHFQNYNLYSLGALHYLPLKIPVIFLSHNYR